MKKGTLLFIIFSFSFFISPAQLTFKSMLDNINCASFGCFNNYMEEQGFRLEKTYLRGTNLTEYFYHTAVADSGYSNLFVIGQRADGQLNYFTLQTQNKALYETLYNDMINQYGYIFNFIDADFELYNSAITRRQVAVRKEDREYTTPVYTFMLYNRENY